MSASNEVCYLMIGQPCVGKTITRKHLVKFSSHLGWQVGSYDDLIIAKAKQLNREPRDIWDAQFPKIRAMVWMQVRNALAGKRPVVWDTHDNVTIEQRREKLAILPPSYGKIAFVFKQPPNWEERLKTRVFDHPLIDIEPVLAEEGFDEIRYIT